jgi:hypothetical protein
MEIKRKITDFRGLSDISQLILANLLAIKHGREMQMAFQINIVSAA